MRVLICPDRMGPLSSRQAGRALAAGWPGAETRSAGEAGDGFVEATADRWGVELRTGVLDGVLLEWAIDGDRVALGLGGAGVVGGPAGPIPYAAGSLDLGRAIATMLAEQRPRQLLVDLTGRDVHDAGAGLLAGLGAVGTGADLTGGVAGLAGVTAVDLRPARERLTGIELVGVVPGRQRDDQFLGLRGITSRRGRAAGEDPAVLLATDAALQALTDLIDPRAALVAVAGACGGLGWVVLALGGSLVTGPEVGLAGATGPYDLMVTGCSVFDFATRGGGVVAAVAELAADRLSPAIVVAGEVLIGAREMRTLGIEAAYAIREFDLDRPTGGAVTVAEVERVGVRIGRSWRW